MQWDLSITDILGTEKQFVHREVSTIQGIFYVHSNLFGSIKVAC